MMTRPKAASSFHGRGKFLYPVLSLFIISSLFLVAFLAYMTVTDYEPQKIIPLQIANTTQKTLKINQHFSIMTFNIGYAGLDKGQDFFMDGGKMSRSRSKDQTMVNLKNITDFIIQEKPDLVVLQEVDISASRSFYLNQLTYMGDRLSGYSRTFGTNYQVQWVPVPIFNPMGFVHSGLTTFSRYQTTSAARYQYPGREAWPRQVFDLDRCFIENRLPTDNGKELVVINSHLSAFDQGGKIRLQQLAFLKEHILREYNRGNYVIVGGDWNHVLPGTDPKLFVTTQGWPFWLQNLPVDFTPEEFKWGVDKTTPTVRTNGRPYIEGINFRVVIDGFLVSPNVEIIEIKGSELNFEHSDHNPVTGIFQLR